MPEYKSPINGQPLPRGKPYVTSEQAREAGKKGGKASAEKRKRMKTLKEELEKLLADEYNGHTVQELITVSLIKQAKEGNIRAFETIRDTIGQKPVDKVEMTAPDFAELDSIKAELMKK